MKVLVIILAALMMLFGLSAGGCALVLFAENITTGIEGFGFSIFIMGVVCAGIAAVLIACAVAIFRRATRKPIGSPTSRPPDDVPQP